MKPFLITYWLEARDTKQFFHHLVNTRQRDEAIPHYLLTGSQRYEAILSPLSDCKQERRRPFLITYWLEARDTKQFFHHLLNTRQRDEAIPYHLLTGSQRYEAIISPLSDCKPERRRPFLITNWLEARDTKQFFDHLLNTRQRDKAIHYHLLTGSQRYEAILSPLTEYTPERQSHSSSITDWKPEIRSNSSTT